MQKKQKWAWGDIKKDMDNLPKIDYYTNMAINSNEVKKTSFFWSLIKSKSFIVLALFIFFMLAISARAETLEYTRTPDGQNVTSPVNFNIEMSGEVGCEGQNWGTEGVDQKTWGIAVCVDGTCSEVYYSSTFVNEGTYTLNTEVFLPSNSYQGVYIACHAHNEESGEWIELGEPLEGGQSETIFTVSQNNTALFSGLGAVLPGVKNSSNATMVSFLIIIGAIGGIAIAIGFSMAIYEGIMESIEHEKKRKEIYMEAVIQHGILQKHLNRNK